MAPNSYGNGSSSDIENISGLQASCWKNPKTCSFPFTSSPLEFGTLNMVSSEIQKNLCQTKFPLGIVTCKTIFLFCHFACCCICVIFSVWDMCKYLHIILCMTQWHKTLRTKQVCHSFFFQSFCSIHKIWYYYIIDIIILIMGEMQIGE